MAEGFGAACKINEARHKSPPGLSRVSTELSHPLLLPHHRRAGFGMPSPFWRGTNPRPRKLLLSYVVAFAGRSSRYPGWPEWHIENPAPTIIQTVLLTFINYSASLYL